MKNRFFRFLIFFIFPVMFWGAPSIELRGILKPHLLEVENGHLFVVQETTVFIFSLSDFRLLKKFGREGEGPGELKGYISAIEVQPEYILVNSIGRLSWFTRSGDFIKQQTSTSLGLNFKLLGDRYVGMRMIREKDSIYFSISIINSDLKILKEIHRYRHPFFQRNRKINPVDIRISSYNVYQNQIFVDKGGLITVFDKDGKELFDVINEFDPVKITVDRKKSYLEFWRSDLKAEYKVYKDRLVFPDYFPSIRDFQVANGRIYVVTYREKKITVSFIYLMRKGNS